MKILVIRLSAMGDVAMSAPVLKAISEQHPDHEFFFLTRNAFKPFFRETENFHFIAAELNGKHKGFFGLSKLFKQLKKDIHPDLIIDLHDVMRTKYLKTRFRFTGTRSFTIDKGRQEKKKLISKTKKVLTELKHTTERYTQTFKDSGLDLKIDKNESAIFKKSISNNKKNTFHIGIAPFAKHFQKQYPLEQMSEVIRLLNSEEYLMYVFGGGEEEKKFALALEKKFKNVTSMIGKMSMNEEIEMISGLDLMITMDSGNMHIAALTGIKIVSIWGATHPYAGFSPFTSEKNSFIIQDDNLNCRPCSVFGNKACYKNSLECMTNIKPEVIYGIIEKALKP